jgi:phenylalanyl-tRNA synthetase alpha chain
VLENLAKHIFGDVEMRWVDAYFPFTDPSIELEIFFNNEWLEILGCGVIHDKVMTKARKDITSEVGWAFGLGLERWAMKLFDI